LDAPHVGSVGVRHATTESGTLDRGSYRGSGQRTRQQRHGRGGGTCKRRAQDRGSSASVHRKCGRAHAIVLEVAMHSLLAASRVPTSTGVVAMASHHIRRAASALPLLRCRLPTASAASPSSSLSARLPQLAGFPHTTRGYQATAAYSAGMPGCVHAVQLAAAVAEQPPRHTRRITPPLL
jgi:hypothetical protein